MTEPIPLWGKTPTEVEIFGERLRDARLIQQLQSQSVAERAGLTPYAYSRLEHSLSTTVEIQRAHNLATALDFPVEFLASAPVTPVQRGSLLFRAKKAMTRAEEDQLVAWTRMIGDLLQRSVCENIRLPYMRVPRITEGTDPVTAAAATREALGLQLDVPIPHVIRTLERGGVYIACLNFDADLHAKYHDAFSTWVGPTLDWALIVVRASSSWERTRLSIAHELGHIVLHHVRRSGDLEAEAYSFAAEFIFPRAVLRDEWPRPATLMSLMPLKRIWGMSLAALIEHGYRNDLIDGTQRINLYKQMSNRRDRQTGKRWRIQEPGWREREPERPKLIARIAEVAFGSEARLDGLADLVYSWRPDLVRQLLAGQVTPWAQDIVGESDVNAGDSGQLAPVVRLDFQ